MNRQDIASNLVSSFESGYIDDDALDALSCSESPAARSSKEDCAPRASSSSSSDLLKQSIHFLTDTPEHPIRALASFDGGLEISYFGRYNALPSGQSILDVLKPLKERARVQAGLIPFLIDDVGFMVHPDGARSGFSYSYKLTILENNRVKYWVMLHTSPCESIPGIRLKCDYAAFRFRSLEDVAQEIKHILDVLGFHVDRETLSRVDFNVTVNRSLDDFSMAYQEDRILNRCGVALYGRKKRVESYRFGKNGGSVSFAVYDKTHELTERYDADKIEDISAVFGSDIQDLTRYEFRVSREFLNSNSIDTFEDFLISFPAIVDYLTCRWFLVIDSSEHSHKKRSELKVAQFWSEIRSAFLVYAISGKSIISTETLKDELNRSDAYTKHYRTLTRRRPLRRFRRKLKSLFSIGLGCFVSAIAYAVPADSSFTPLQFQQAITKYASYYADTAYKSFNERRVAFGALEVLHSQAVQVQQSANSDLFEYQENGAIYV